MKKLFILMIVITMVAFTGCSDKLMDNAVVIKEEVNQKMGSRFDAEITKLEKVKDSGTSYIYFYSGEEVVFLMREGSLKENYILSIVVNSETGDLQEYNQMPILDLVQVVRNNLIDDLLMVYMQKQLGL